MVKKASEMEDSDKKLAYTELIGNFMKLAYKTWSNEEVSLELVKGDMISISAGQPNQRVSKTKITIIEIGKTIIIKRTKIIVKNIKHEFRYF